MSKQRLSRVVSIGATLLFLTATHSALPESYAVFPQDHRYTTILKLIQEREYPKAFAECQLLIEASPQMELAYKRLAETANAAGLVAEAESFLNNLVAQTPTQQALKHYGLATLYNLKATDRNNQQRVIEHCQRSLSLAPGFTRPYKMLVDAYLRLGQAEEANAYLSTVSQQQPDNAAVFYGLGYFYKQKNNYAESLKFLDQALALAPNLRDALYEKSAVLVRTNKPADDAVALQLSAQLLLTAREQGELEQQIRVLVLRGYVQNKSGQPQQAIQSYTEALRLAEFTSEVEQRDYLLGALCESYILQDDYANGLATCRRELSAASSNIREYTLGNLGVAYRRLGATDLGISSYRQGLELARKRKNVDAQIFLLTNLGGAYNELKRYDEAQRLLYEAVELADQSDDPSRKSPTLASLGRLHYELGNYQQALAIQEEARQISQSIGKPIQVGLSLHWLGLTYAKLNEWSKALQAQQDALQIGEQINSARLVWSAQSGMAAIHRQLNQPEQAKEHYSLAIEALEKTRKRLNEDEDKIGFWQDKVKVYKDMLSLLMESASPASREAQEQRAAEAFHLSESWRARAFLDLLVAARIKPESKRLPRAAVPASTQPAHWPGSSPIGLTEAQARLDNRTAVLAYSLGESESFLFVISRRDFAVHKLASEKDINENTSRLIKLLADKQQFLPDRYWQEARALSRQLIGPARSQLAGKTQLVIVADGALQRLPFEALLKETAEQQATAALNEWPYLIKDFAISYAPSVSIWANLQAETYRVRPERKDFIAFGDPLYGEHSSALSTALSQTTRTDTPGQLAPLPHSRDEVEKIAALFPRKRVALFLGARANEENVKATGHLGQYRFVHFSVHALMSETAPGFSGLLLSPRAATANTAGGAPHTASDEDGVLTTSEIFKLRLNAELVSLSACETGLGKEINGEGLMGLMRAFIYAGTPSVLVSLWKVDDEAAADQMIRFYQYLLKGKAQGQLSRLNKAQALRQAQLDAIRRGSVPYFWAPFVLVGNP